LKGQAAGAGAFTGGDLVIEGGTGATAGSVRIGTASGYVLLGASSVPVTAAGLFISSSGMQHRLA